MKRIMQKALMRTAVILLCAALLAAPMGAFGAAAYTYNPQAALTYAAEHWNDGVGLCATFVSACVTAGGIPTYQPGVENLYHHLEGYGTTYRLTPRNNRYYYSDNAGKVSAGDPLFFVCETCGNEYLHAALCSSIGADGLVHDYAHNNAHNNTITYEELRRSDHPDLTHKIVLYALHMNAAAISTEPGVLTNNNGSATLFWPSVSGASSYTVQVFSDTGASVARQEGLTGNSCTVALAAGSYTASVMAMGANGRLSEVVIGPFTVQAAAPATSEQETTAPSGDSSSSIAESLILLLSTALQAFVQLLQFVMRFFG